MNFFQQLFWAQGFIPHGTSYLWDSSLIWLHALSDGLISLSYYTITLTLLYFVWRYKNLPFYEIYLWFALSIVACGTAHLLEVWNIWHPAYWLSGIVKALTALVSVFAASALVWLVPRALVLPSPRLLRDANHSLKEEMKQRRQAEVEVRSLNSALELQVNQATAALGELESSRQQLQAAGLAKNRFLANMSHELRTPLNGVIGFTEFLADGKPGPLNPKQKEYLEDILKSGCHLLQLVNDVLDLAKVESGKMEFHPAPFSLSKAIEEVCAVSRPLVQKKKISLQVDTALGLGPVTLDPQKFKQILYNPLSNAVKFTDDEGKVAIRSAPAGPSHFRMIVEDSGVGIKDEDLGRLFKEFEQLESHTTRHHEGTGLGLALTRKIIEAQAGEISVTSQIGKGSAFTVLLPLVMAKGAALKAGSHA